MRHLAMNYIYNDTFIKLKEKIRLNDLYRK